MNLPCCACGKCDSRTKGLVRAAMRKPKRDKSEGPRKVTGFRLVRGTHGATYVADPRGTDRLPKFYTGATT